MRIIKPNCHTDHRVQFLNEKLCEELKHPISLQLFTREGQITRPVPNAPMSLYIHFQRVMVGQREAGQDRTAALTPQAPGSR